MGLTNCLTLSEARHIPTASPLSSAPAATAAVSSAAYSCLSFSCEPNSMVFELSITNIMVRFLSSTYSRTRSFPPLSECSQSISLASSAGVYCLKSANSMPLPLNTLGYSPMNFVATLYFVATCRCFIFLVRLKCTSFSCGISPRFRGRAPPQDFLCRLGLGFFFGLAFVIEYYPVPQYVGRDVAHVFGSDERVAAHERLRLACCVHAD